MKLAIAIAFAAYFLTACTSRGGWPRFLRPGEMTDGQMKQYYKDHPEIYRNQP